MDDLALTALFARYRDHRDADALARVFDALAPGLLKVARHLTADRALAEDLLQATFLTAMERASRFDDSRLIRPWLAGILVHHARHQHRKGARRPDGRRLAPPPVLDPGAAAEGRELEREVDRALESLPEKYRKVLLPRLRQGKKGTEIARDMGRSPGTVRMQIHRGLGLLRSLLPHSLLAFLAMLLWSRSALAGVRAEVLARAAGATATAPVAPALTLGGLIMIKKTLVVAVCAVVLIGVSAGILWTGDENGVESEKCADCDPVTTAQSSEPADRSEPLEVEADRIPLPPHDNDGQTDKEAGTLCSGRVLDALGNPVAGATILFDMEGGEGVTSDATGSFEYRTTTPQMIPGTAPPFAVIRAGRDGSGEGYLLVVAQSVDVTGTVVDEEGFALAGVSVTPEPGRLLDFPVVIDRTDPFYRPSMLTDETGLFAWKGLPAGFTTLQFEKKGYEPLRHRVEPDDARPARYVLRRLEERMRVLAGVVLDHEDRTVSGANVYLGKNAALTDEWGEFTIEFEAGTLSGKDSLFAAKPGFATRVHAGFGADIDALDEPFIEIRFAGPALTITGRLLDAGGEPISGSGISLWKEEFLRGFRSAEAFAIADEDVQKGDIIGRRAVAVTDEAGRFVLRGLSDRDYNLRILDFGKGFAFTRGPFPAGARNVEIRIPPDAFIETLTGIVVTRQGEPVAGAEVAATMQSARNSWCDSWYRIRTVETGPDGRFTMKNVCRLDRVAFHISGDAIVPLSIEAVHDPAPSGNRFVAGLRCHFRVELSDPSLADRFHILDDRGEKMKIWQFTHRGRGAGYRYYIDLKDGKTEVITATERACQLVLQGEREIRVPIRLAPGEVTVVHR